MAIEKITSVEGSAVHVAGADVDTDRIIPARFMKCVTFDGLGEYLFYDVRFDEDGNERSHPLNDKKYEGASILLAGNNFGCGSSREHAPQALYRYGFRAVIAESFAEIFFGNCATLGVPCVCASASDILEMAEVVENDPTVEVTIDIEEREVRAGDEKWAVEILDSARDAFLSARWDPMGGLLEGASDVEDTASKLSYMSH